MRIGIVNSLNLEKRTGVEEYVYQLLKHLPAVDDYKNHHFFYLNRKTLKWPLKKLWTQIRLSWEMLKNPVDVLFIPAHSFPFFTKKLVITIHGLEYENVPQTYSWWQRIKSRFLTKRSAKKADKIIVPSRFVKNDLIRFYKINPEKIFVVYHGINQNYEVGIKNNEFINKYILCIGGTHKRKNIGKLVEAFEVLQKKYTTEYELILVGLKFIIHNSKFKANKNIILKDFISEPEKWNLLRNAAALVYPSLCEGFGFPPLEAQRVGVPVVSSNVSAIPEILSDSALLVNPNNPEEIAEAIYRVLNDEKLRNDLIKKGQENVKRFSWPNCAKETLQIISNF